MDPKHLIPGDAILIENIVNYLKAKGIFDEFRHECLADVDTKSSCQNLSQRIDGYTSKFLANETWHPDLNKNELRNKLRRHIDESGLLAVGADHVVEQVINTKIYQLFFPKIFEVVHQYVKEQSESLSKKQEANVFSESTSEKTIPEVVDNKDKTSISDPIADILSFTYSKSKPPARKADPSKVKKEENIVHIPEKSTSEKPSDNLTSISSEAKPVIDKEKEKNKKEELDNSQEAKKNFVKEEVKLERKKSEDIKAPVSEMTSSTDIKKIKKESSDKSTCETGNSIEVKKPKTESIDKPSEKSSSDLSSSNEAKKPKKEASDKASEKNVSEAGTSSEESKSSVSAPVKSILSSKKDFDKNKQKSKSLSTQKSSGEVKKPKKESSDKSSEKHFKSKPSKSFKESSSPTKHVGSSKSLRKEEKRERSKSSDSSNNKISESSSKKTKSSSNKKDNSSLKHKEISDKSDKSKASKSADKSDNSHIHPDSSNSEKSSKNIHYSSSYDSSQGSDQEKSSSSSKRERLKHFSKHAKKEKSDNSDSGSRSHEKKRITDGDESPSKKHKSEKDPKFSFKDNTVTEAAKISSRSNSFGSSSSVSSSSNASKDNLASNSEDQVESSSKDKKKKQAKDKDSCHDPKSLPPPPPPPPASGSTSCELTSSAEPSSMEDTQSSSESESSVSDEEISEESSSDSELESKDLIQTTLKESALNSSTDNINAFYDIFLYSSSSSEFEGYGNSPEKKKSSEDVNKEPGSEVSVSSVHTSDLSSYDDELSSDEDVSLLTGGVKRRLTLKEAQELLQNRAILREKNKNPPTADKKDANEVIMNKRGPRTSSSLFSSEEESSPSEPVRSLRRERKLNPRYASSEYTSIFNSRKETFITKQSSPSVRNSSLESSPNTELKNKKIDSLVQNSKSMKKNSFESKLNEIQKDEIKQTAEDKHVNAESQNELSDNGESSSSDEMDSIMNNEKLFQENNKTENVSDNDKLKLSVKVNPQNNSKLNVNKYSLKRKREICESTPMKRPSSRSSVDSSSSEIVSNENKPFNNEKQSFDEKVLKDNLRASDLTDGIKKDLFCKQRTNNNGDILGQKDIFSKNPHNKTISNSEKKTSES